MERANSIMADLKEADSLDIAMLSVALREIRNLSETESATASAPGPMIDEALAVAYPVAARSAALRSMQSSLPSGSASTTQPVPSDRRRSATMVAPIASSRSASSSRVLSVGTRSRWTRFLTVFGSGTVMNSSPGCRPARPDTPRGRLGDWGSRGPPGSR